MGLKKNFMTKLILSPFHILFSQTGIISHFFFYTPTWITAGPTGEESNVVLFWHFISLERPELIQIWVLHLSPHSLSLLSFYSPFTAHIPQGRTGLLRQCQAFLLVWLFSARGGLPGPLGPSCVVVRILIIRQHLVFSLDWHNCSGFTLHLAKMVSGFISYCWVVSTKGSEPFHTFPSYLEAKSRMHICL